MQVLDRKRVGRRPNHVDSWLDIPAQYYVVRRNGATEWVKGTLLQGEELTLVKAFELRFRRSAALPCNPVRDYAPALREEDPDSEDEVDLVYHGELDRHYGIQ